MGGNVESDIDYGEGIRYELTVGTTTFFVAGQRVLDAFATGGVYRAYYAAGGGHAVMNRLLSAERIGCSRYSSMARMSAEVSRLAAKSPLPSTSANRAALRSLSAATFCSIVSFAIMR